MGKRFIMVTLILMLVMPLASCSNTDGNEVLLDDAYPKDIFRIYEKSKLVEFSSQSTDDGGISYFIKAKSNHKTADIMEYYSILLQNADISNKSMENEAYVMDGSFYGYQFTIHITPDTEDKKYKTVFTISLEQIMQQDGDCDTSELTEDIQNNNNIQDKLELKDINSLGDTRLSTMVSACCNNSADDWVGWVDSQKQDGFTEIRFAMNHIDAIYPNDDYEKYLAVEQDFPDEYKKVFEHAHELGMTVRYVLSFWDYQNRKDGGGFSINRLDTQDEIDRYIQYIRMTVSELRGLVDRYELWNEPDANYEGYQKIQPEDYINMARQAIGAIREIDPDTEIIGLSTCGFLTEEEKAYTLQILNSDVSSLVDAISLHTVNVDAMPQNRNEYYYNYDNMMKELLDTAQSNGFSGIMIADELNYRSHYSLNVLQKEDPNFYFPTEPEVAAKNIARMMVINRGIGIYVGMSGTNSFERVIEGKIIRDYNRMMAGLSPADLEVGTQSQSQFVRYYAFHDEEGELYIAVWNDIAPVPGHELTVCDLRIEGVSFKSAAWLDPYYTFYKTLEIESGVDGTYIRGLKIPDYPIFIKLNQNN